jgi:hypothetical protein
MTFRHPSKATLVRIRETLIEKLNQYIVVLCVAINSVGKKAKKFVKHVSLKNAVR